MDQHGVMVIDNHTWTSLPNPGLSGVVAPGTPNALGSCARTRNWATAGRHPEERGGGAGMRGGRLERQYEP